MEFSLLSYQAYDTTIKYEEPSMNVLDAERTWQRLSSKVVWTWKLIVINFDHIRHYAHRIGKNFTGRSVNFMVFVWVWKGLKDCTVFILATDNVKFLFTDWPVGNQKHCFFLQSKTIFW